MSDMKFPRILRGILKSAVTWGIAWVPFTAAFLGIATLFGAPIPGAVVIPILIRAAIGGAINGAVFSVALAIAGRNKTPETLSGGVLIACGAIGGAFFPALMLGALTATSITLPMIAVLLNIGIGALMGTAFAGITLKAIRHAAMLPAPPGEDLNVLPTESPAALR
jgi:hypothetical protein